MGTKAVLAALAAAEPPGVPHGSKYMLKCPEGYFSN